VPERWWVYLLRCGDGSLYTGITNDLEKRATRHNAGKASRYTRSRLPVELVYREEQPDRSAASKREAALKKLTRVEKETLVRSQAPTDSRPAS
jgi:putative endonuclease